MAKTLLDFTPSTVSQLNDNMVVYLVDPAAGRAGDITCTLATLKAYLGVTGNQPDPDPDPPPPGTVATPTFSPVGGSYSGPQSVTISTTESGATIYYTTNGSTPTTSSSVYSGPLTVSDTTTLKALAAKSGMTNSNVATAIYTITSIPPDPEADNPTGFINLYGVDRAEYPRLYITSRMPVRTGALITVASGGDLQAALNSAQPGDWVVLEAGATFVGNFELPLRNGSALPGDDNVIVVTTSAFASLPEKVRVTRATSDALFANIRSDTVGNVEALKTVGATKGWRLVGLDISIGAGVPEVSRIVAIGSGDGGIQNTLAQQPSNIIMDRCRVNGHDTLAVSRGVQLESAYSGVINSCIGPEIHRTGQDTQCVVSWNSTGPHKLVNNEFSGGAEVVMYGGAGNSLGCASDIEIRYNKFTRPMAWRGVETWAVKNIFEIKKARRVLIEGNEFENVWPDGQAGFGWLIKHEPYFDEALGVTEDIIFKYNRMHDAAGGIDIATASDNNGGSTLNVIRRVVLYHNLLRDISNADNESTTGYLYQLSSRACVHSHNTFMGDGTANTAISVEGDVAGNFFKDNIFGNSNYGVKGSGSGTGNSSLAVYNVGGEFTKNLIIGANAGDYPSDTMTPANIAAVGFVDAANDDYTLSNASLYKNQGSDGTDPGCNVPAVMSKVNLALSGNTTTVQT